jgi:hypothetical protein
MKTFGPSLRCGLAAACLAACGGRDPKWDATLEGRALPPPTIGLTGSVAVLDRPLDRVLLIGTDDDESLWTKPLPVGKSVVELAPSADRSKLFALSTGVQPRRRPDDELPSLSIIDGGRSPALLARHELSDPLGGLAVDPEGEWVVVYDAGGIVVNPNELILVAVNEPAQAPINKTIRSFGGRPQRLTFTGELTVPKGPPRRLLVVETEYDVTLVDLAFPERPEVTVILPKTPSGEPGQPVQVAFHDGDPDDAGDARVAVRLKDDSSVVLLELDPPTEPERDFEATVNVADVGGEPSGIDFVMADGRPHLAALVPSLEASALVDPATSVVTHVELPGAYRSIARVTDDVADKPASGDVALLWDGDANDGIAFWSLGRSASKPFRSVEAQSIGIVVTQVKDVPGEKYGHRKILEGEHASEFYVLDLNARTTFPMLTDAAGFELGVSPTGELAWALLPGTPQFARIDLGTLHPSSLEIERDIYAVFDVESTAGRDVLAFHSSATLGVTVLDALRPDTAASRYYAALLLGGLP